MVKTTRLTTKPNPRKVALDRISTKIATFLVTETFTDEGPARLQLGLAVQALDAAVELLVASDLAAETKAPL